MSEKIKQHHLERGAYVYVRQSTPYQVRNHVEEKERQYSLAERAKQLGFGKAIVIDEDLGRSGGGLRKTPRACAETACLPSKTEKVRTPFTRPSYTP
jgi:hypothetical protein